MWRWHVPAGDVVQTTRMTDLYEYSRSSPRLRNQGPRFEELEITPQRVGVYPYSVARAFYYSAWDGLRGRPFP